LVVPVRRTAGAMGIIKEYRIVMPVTVQEYRIAQIYMTARTQAMEAEQVRRRRRTIQPPPRRHPGAQRAGWVTALCVRACARARVRACVQVCVRA